MLKLLSHKQGKNQRNILKELYFSKGLSYSEISSRTKKSLPLVTTLATDLLNKEYIVETGLAVSTGGRRPQMFSIRADSMYIVSVAMDQFFTRLSIMDMHNNHIAAISSQPLPLANNKNAIIGLIELIENFIKSSDVPVDKIIGIGIGMPGFIDTNKGINHTFLKAPGKSITKFISEKIKIPVFIDNDSSLIALAEHKFGVAKNKRNAMIINVGWGVGLGMILNNELYRGSDGFAGEFSHVPVFNNNKICTCGKIGCLETETSLSVIIENAKQAIMKGGSSVMSIEKLSSKDFEEAFEDIKNAAYKGDRLAVELFSNIGYNIGRGVAILIHLLNPELVVLSGRGALAGKIWQAPIQQAINEHCIPILGENISIEISPNGYEAELIGGAALVIDNLIKL